MLSSRAKINFSYIVFYLLLKCFSKSIVIDWQKQIELTKNWSQGKTICLIYDNKFLNIYARVLRLHKDRNFFLLFLLYLFAFYLHIWL